VESSPSQGKAPAQRRAVLLQFEGIESVSREQSWCCWTALKPVMHVSENSAPGKKRTGRPSDDEDNDEYNPNESTTDDADGSSSADEEDSDDNKAQGASPIAKGSAAKKHSSAGGPKSLLHEVCEGSTRRWIVFAGTNQELLPQLSWFRVILDEAHYIKTRSTSTAKAVFALVSLHKWCLTGTPLQVRPSHLTGWLAFPYMRC
jgi:hypothetical protein